MSGPSRIEGFAIVSADGMLADAAGLMPDTLKFEVDQTFFADGLDRLDAVIHGANSHEMQPHSDARSRIIVTRNIPAIAQHPDNPLATLWNPAGATFSAAWEALGIADGSLGVIGGTRIFGMFLNAYDWFHLSRARHARLPGGRPVFPNVPARTPEDVLLAHRLRPGPARVLDADAGVTLVSWQR